MSFADLRRMALFTLGAARRTAAPADVEDFVNAFREYSVVVYESKLNPSLDKLLTVTASTTRAAGDYVESIVLANSPGQTTGPDTVAIDFRILSDKGNFVAIDASFAGVWLAIEERDQFTTFLQQNNNSVPRLTSHLQQLTQELTEQLRADGR